MQDLSICYRHQRVEMEVSGLMTSYQVQWVADGKKQVISDGNRDTFLFILERFPFQCRNQGGRIRTRLYVPCDVETDFHATACACNHTRNEGRESIYAV